MIVIKHWSHVEGLFPAAVVNVALVFDDEAAWG